MTTPKISFYILTESGTKARDLFTCRLIEKAYNSACKIYVLTASADETTTFDTQLWTFRDVSFVPHKIYMPNTNQEQPVLIGTIEPPASHRNVLVNLSADVPNFFDKFERILEVIPNDEQAKALGRKRYHLYQQHGCEIETFDIT